jgi:DNA-binding transcriptional LysR family regulator
MHLESLITFKKVIDEASYSKAAAALFISQPSASQQVRHLERFFGSKLIETSAGRNPQP